MILETVFWIGVAYVTLSLTEYLAHRWPMHSRRFVRRWPWFDGTLERHAVLHHGRWYKTFDDEPDIAARHVNLTIHPLVHLGMFAPIIAVFYMASTTGAIVLACGVVLHAVVWSTIHTEMHRPGGRWFSQWWLYRHLRNYHKTHHEHPGTNFNVVCPLMDTLFGTRRKDA